jgi:hypothetical protein
MSVTIAHRPHIQVPRLPVIVVLALAAAAALVVALSIPASTTTPAATFVETLGTTGASVTADVPRDRSPIVRAIVSGEIPAAAPAEAPAPLRKSTRTPWLAGGGTASSK